MLDSLGENLLFHSDVRRAALEAQVSGNAIAPALGAILFNCVPTNCERVSRDRVMEDGRFRQSHKKGRQGSCA
jgi:hypothetical protein